MVGRQPVLVTEVPAAVLAVKRHRGGFTAKVTAWHLYSSLYFPTFKSCGRAIETR
jgi:hypothetical protein